MQIALFGGTFDPVHNAHLAVARGARDHFGLDQVLLIPAAVPPHKQDRLGESWQHRWRMVAIACAGEFALEASDLESAPEKSYSINTIHHVKQRLQPGDQLFFIIGSDAFSEIHTWHRWLEVISAVEFIVVTRPGHDYVIPEGARVRRLDGIHLPVSSSVIREKLAKCEPPVELPAPVFEYIREHQLYGFGSAIETGSVKAVQRNSISR